MPKLSPAQRQMIRRRTRKPDADPSETSSELNIIPFLDIVVNLIMFLLVTTTTVLAITQVEAQLPTRERPGTSCRDCTDPLNLTVTLGDRGIVMAGSGGVLSEGCEELSGGVAVPKNGAQHDFEGLTACAVQVKARYPEVREVILTADPTVPYEDLIGAMDALRTDGERELFPEVLLAAGIR